jgi:NAD(P)-dependent dehydrogenase (short-subunit alcohol dehydrogenase family)
MSNVDNKVVWIIGGSGGIGSNLARRMSDNGWKVIISARNIENLNLVSDGKSIDSLIVDATNADDVQEKAKQINETYGSLDAVVNSVGSIFLRPLHATSSEQFMETINQNLVTSFNVIRATAKIMMRGNGGRIVLFSSAAASLGMPNHAAISAAKAGVEGLARAAASDYAKRGIRVNVISPGLVDTPLSSHLLASEQSRKISEDMHPVGKIGEPDDIASVAEWLITSAPEWMTGDIIPVDGGLTNLK